jgi:hypothetical protein
MKSNEIDCDAEVDEIEQLIVKQNNFDKMRLQ